MMKKASSLAFFAVLAVLLAGCSGDSRRLTEPQVTGIPFQSEEDGKWGMLSADGKVIFSEKLEQKPHLAYDNRFFMYDKEEGTYSLYTCEAEPQKIAGGFVDVKRFINGKALVAKPGEYVQLIGLDGTVLKTLDTVSGKQVEKVTMADNGYLRFMTTDHLWGLLDADGNVLFEPVYGSLWYEDGVVLTNPEEERFFYEHHVTHQMTDHIVNLKGEESGVIQGSRYVSTGIYEGKYISAYKASEGEDADDRAYALFDLKGEPVVKASKHINKIRVFKGEEFVYYDGDNYGLMNTEGQVLMEPEYDDLWFFGDKLMLAGEKDADYKTIGTVVDRQGKKVGQTEFLMNRAIDFPRLGNKYAMLQTTDEKYVLVKQDGTILEGLPEIVDISTWYQSDDYVTSQHVDVEAFANHLNISSKGADGLSVYMTPEVFVNAKKDELTTWLYDVMDDKDLLKPDEVYDYMKEKPIESPFYYSSTFLGDKNYVEYFPEYNGVKYSMLVKFDDGIVKEKNDDYSFVDKPMTLMSIYLSNSGKKEGYMKLFYNAFASRMRPLGKVYLENDNFLCLTTEGELIEVYMGDDGNSVTIWIERLKPGYGPNEKILKEKAEKRKNVKEDCRVEMKK